MKRIILSCGMLADELKLACKGIKGLDIEEFPRGMHADPKKLNEKLMEWINEHQNVDEIVLTFGLCGNGTAGLYSKNTKLIIPKFDDCISQLLYKEEEGRIRRSNIEKGHLYLTRGWTIDEKSILGQCKKIEEEYPENAQEIMEQIYGGYNNITIINTGAYDLEEVINEAKKIKKYLKINVDIQRGSISILKKILSREYDDNFIILNPGEKLREDMFRFNGK